MLTMAVKILKSSSKAQAHLLVPKEAHSLKTQGPIQIYRTECIYHCLSLVIAQMGLVLYFLDPSCKVL